MRVFFLALLFAAVFATEASGADQVRNGPQPPEIDTRSVSLNGMVVQAVWRVRMGDDPALAQPEVDDHAWPATQAGGLLPKLHPGPFQPMWYRTHVSIPAGAHGLAMFLAQQRGPERFYVNGVLVDSHGRLGPGEGSPSFAHHFFVIPDSALRPGDNVLAIRTNAGPEGEAFFGDQTVLLAGPANALQDYLSLLEFQNFVSNTTEVVIEALLLLLAGALMLAMRREREYQALVGLVAALLLSDTLQIWILSVGMPTTPGSLFLEVVLNAFACVLLIELVREILRVHGSWHFKVLYAFVGVSVLPFWAVRSAQLQAHSMSTGLLEATWWLYHLGVFVPQIVLPFVCFTFALRRKSVELGLLGIPLLVEGGLLQTILLAHVHLAPDLYDAQLRMGTLYVKCSELSRILLGSTLLVFLMLRTVRIARERAAITRELEAAQTVQQLLLGSAHAAAPGFRVETAYLPASEVGGDFFHIAPGEDGSLLVVAGDVSGKGLRAAMTVSAIVGALRTLTERSPAAILQQLNRMLVGHMDGFATCCAAVIAPDGQIRMANAGHLSPYINQVEATLPGSLPLGITDGLEYEEVSAFLPVAGRVVFVSDGVIEAADPRSRELFGFERTSRLLDHSAQGIAKAAQSYGQTDDISVVVVERL